MKYLKIIKSKMGFPKDIVNIVRCIKSKDEKKRLNCNYYDKYCTTDNMFDRHGICLRYKYTSFFINNRNIIGENYCKEIVCFLTDRKTKYKVPKNY